MELEIYLFISEVEKKTAIWDMKSNEYSNRTLIKEKLGKSWFSCLVTLKIQKIKMQCLFCFNFFVICLLYIIRLVSSQKNKKRAKRRIPANS